MLPTTSIDDARFAPDSGGAIEVEEAPAATAGGLLHQQVAVEEHRLDAGEE
jgi:hypothetical protein